jgi:predicted MFS family arabinose efflux permease
MPSPRYGSGERFATRAAFLIAGFAGAVWAAVVPFAQARIGVDAGGLGALLLCMGLGSIVTMPLAGAAAARWGCRVVILVAAALTALVLPALAIVSHPVLLGVALFALGAGIGTIDCVINIQAVQVERDAGRALMSGFHGLFSVGGIAWAGGAAAMLSLGASPLETTLAGSATIVLAAVASARWLLSTGEPRSGALFAVPRGVVLLIGVLCFVCFLAEGAILDWSAVFLTTVRDLDPARAGLGYAAFATTMTVGRLTGDLIVGRMGGPRIILFGGACAATGLAVTTAVPYWEAALAGYALVGLGCSNIVPVLYSALGRQKVMPEHIAVPAVTTLGYSGILSGPALIGGLAHATSLPFAFVLVALGMVWLAFNGRVARAGGRGGFWAGPDGAAPGRASRRRHHHPQDAEAVLDHAEGG